MSELPITVVVPHLKSRDDLYENYCLPSILANNPSEILTLSGPEHVQWKRNEGARKAKNKFLFFCDDDIIMGKDMLRKLHASIGKHDFAYCDYLAANHPVPNFLKHTAKDFNARELQRANYISCMSLVRASAFPGFDENLNRLQDWDMFLTMVSNGSTGIYVPDTNFIAFWFDKGITNSNKSEWQNAANAVRKKHGI